MLHEFLHYLIVNFKSNQAKYKNLVYYHQTFIIHLLRTILYNKN